MPDILIEGKDGTFGAYLALPATLPAPAVIMIQEIFGVNADMRAKCDEMAAQGYVAIAPDLFWRLEPGVQLTDRSEAEWQKAFDLYNRFDIDRGVDDLRATLGYIRGHEACSGKVGCVGFCLGGKLAYLLAANSDVDVSVCYYGVGLENLTGEVRKVTHPLLMHIAELDKFVPPEAQAKILKAAATNPLISPFSYAGVNHAFSRRNGEHYDEKAAALAHERTREFLAAALR